MISAKKIDQLLQRYGEIEAKMVSGPDPETYVKLASEFSELGPVIDKIRELNTIKKELTEVVELLSSPEIEEEMRELVDLEKSELEMRMQQCSQTLQIMLLPKDIADDKSVIIEVRAGTGGLEAALFAGDLYRMYERYASDNHWKSEIMSASEGEAGGYKEIILSVRGKGAYARLKFESGVHRVQRVPETESSGRIHTSAATVAVLPEAEEIDVEIRNEDLRIDTMRASGAGGQHVNTTDSAVRITHIPSGIVVLQSEKSQHQNRARAMQILRARLFDEGRLKALKERAETRRTQVGSGDRSERVRTYNFPQGRVTDHRINLTLYKLERILTGEGLDEIINGLAVNHTANMLLELDESA